MIVPTATKAIQCENYESRANLDISCHGIYWISIIITII